MRIREYSIETKKLNTDLKICVVSDLHAMKYTDCIEAVRGSCADLIICAGDMLERLDGVRDGDNKQGFEFLNLVSKIAPTYYAFGNHERFGSHFERFKSSLGVLKITESNFKRLESSGVVLINDSYSECKKKDSKILIGGLMPVSDDSQDEPNIQFLNDFSSMLGFKILVSHQPEYYDKYLKGRDLDLIISGHTHGGQWKLFGRGIYAPNQGLFPKYTSGLYDGRLVVCAGASNPKKFIPRFFNPCEIAILNIKAK